MEELMTTTYMKRQDEREAFLKQNPWFLKYENSVREFNPGLCEQRIRECFERYFAARFLPCYEEWNRNHWTNLKLELDGYNSDLRIAFEYNSTFCHSTNKQTIKDECKKINCAEYGVKLYVIEEELISPLNIDSDEELYAKVSQFIEGKLARPEPEPHWFSKKFTDH